MSVLAEFRALDRRNWSLAGARLVVQAGFSMVLPFLSIYLAVDRKQPAVVVGLIATAAGACGAAMQWVAGSLSDHVGRRPVMLASMIVRAANLVGLGYATATNAPVLVIAALIVANAVLRGCFDPLANALVADLAPPQQRVAAFSLQRVGINIGWAAGNATALLSAGHSYSVLFYWAAPITLLAAFGVYRIPEPPRSATRPPGWRQMFAFLDDRPLVRFLVATVSFYVLQVQLYQSLSIYAAKVLHMSRGQVATMYWLNGVMVVCLQVPAASYIRRIGTRGALMVGCLGYAASYASAGLARGYLTMLLCVACGTLAEMVTAPAQQTTITSLAPAGRVGVYTGLFGLCQVVGQSAGPLIGTAMLDAMPARVAWFVLALFGVAAARLYRAPTDG